MKRILGLDLGTNSIGWALVEHSFENKTGKILGVGSRIIPMSQDILGDFGKGNSVSQTAERTGYRGIRRLRERHLLRRERLHRVLNVLGYLPQHYARQIDFDKRLGKFKTGTEPKLAYHDREFLFQDSFKEMLEDFRQHQPEMLVDKNGSACLIPYDWTIYYLRKKALSEKISKEELAWIILNFNQKRGYYQLRGEEEDENPNKKIEFHSLRIVDVVADPDTNQRGETWYSLHLENGWIYRRSSKIPLDDWKDKVRDFIVTTDINDDGTEKLDKEGEVKRSFRAPGADDWTLLKKKTEQEIDRSDKTVGAYIYDHLLSNPKQKIKGKLVRTIERKFYKEELKRILQKQSEFHPEFKDETRLSDCVRELYRHNEQHREMLLGKDLLHLILEDIIFYQRPLRSQKSLISNCSLETRKYRDKEGNEQIASLKVIAKSNPYYQEFRLLQWLQNLEIYKKDDDQKATHEFVSNLEDKQALFEFLNSRKDIKQDQLIEFLLKRKQNLKRVTKDDVAKYRWNYVEDKVYPANETRSSIQSRLEKVEGVPENFLTRDIEMALWHIIYSVTDRIEYEKALAKFAKKNQLPETQFVEAFKKIPPFKSEYGSFSEKAIKKLLPLMRFGKYWVYDQVDPASQSRIDKILTGEYDENIKDRVREKAQHLKSEHDFQNLPLWLAQYVVYGRHSEAAVAGKWNSAADLEQFLSDFKQHSLRNPIVEQVVTETLRVVKDIWMKYGKGAKDFFSEIHIELGREMKLPAEERQKMTRQITENENTNLRIKALLAELALDPEVKNVRPFSPVQHTILKIYEEAVLDAEENIDEEILKISKTAQPSSADLRRYKLWLEQKYRSPYTGQPIPLSKLFTPEYEIEHIIPQSVYFDDSFSNKIICEAAVNKLKDNALGASFIKAYQGAIVDCGNGKTVKISSVEEYERFVQQNYAKNRAKRNKLLMEEIPDKMIERQMNDTRYISKYISNILSNIVRDDNPGSNDDGVNSKNLLPGNGKVTSRLKQDWGLNDVWNDLILPRFERMNVLTQSEDFTAWNEKHQKFLPTVPIELSKGFSKKRIDHRHHAMDALVIACATRDHINLLNNESAKSSSKRHDLNRKLRHYENVVYTHPHTGERIEREVPKDFMKPWPTFTVDAKSAIEKIVVSFKQNLRVINKATNYYESYMDENGNIRIDKNGKAQKGKLAQKGTNWAIRKPLHKETVSGRVQLDRVKVSKGKILTATRKTVDGSFNEKNILSITDTGIQKILLNYLKVKGSPETAFSPEGIEEMNENIRLYNDGKNHQPILKVRVFEQGSKFPLGETGNKAAKFVEAAKGTNLFFGIYTDKNGKRSYDTIPLNVVIERQKQGLPPVPEKNEKGHQLLFSLSPHDLVYVPENGEDIDPNKLDAKMIYKVVSFTGSRLYVVPHWVATVIANKIEFTQLNKIELTKEKEILGKLVVNRLGEI